jgi:hypothetical protein
MKHAVLTTLVIAIVALVTLGKESKAEEGHAMKIRFVIGSTTLPATLDDSAAGRDFFSMLPLTLPMKDFAGREKISGSLSKVLDQRGAAAGYDPSVGDITYYAPWANLALFYREASYAKGLVRLGQFDGDIATLGSQKHDFEVRIEAVE